MWQIINTTNYISNYDSTKMDWTLQLKNNHFQTGQKCKTQLYFAYKIIFNWLKMVAQ